jgi:hypothetical protein
MTVTGLPRWGIHLKPGDAVRINASYDNSIQSTYEDMGIAVAMIAPDLPNGTKTAPGVDPFVAPLDTSATCTSGGVSAGTVCDKGKVTHGHLLEAQTYGGASGTYPGKAGQSVSQVHVGAFTYQPGDLSTTNTGATAGVPVVPLGQTLTFVNEDAAADVYHTITTCAYPCSGATGLSFPLANGATNRNRSVEFDSAELGYGPPIGPAKNSATWDLPVTPANGFKPGEVVTYYCRIHPFMRGAFEVGTSQ